MQALYFAYGSNLLSSRMQARVPSARARGTAQLAGYALTTDKAGRDGTAKANLARRDGGRVWGIVWQLDPDEWPLLDACERGYARRAVALSSGSAETYLSDRLTDDPVLSLEYKAYLVDGAREQGLPGAWIARLEALPAR